jgi:hypothetical protein
MDINDASITTLIREAVESVLELNDDAGYAGYGSRTFIQDLACAGIIEMTGTEFILHLTLPNRRFRVTVREL